MNKQSYCEANSFTSSYFLWGVTSSSVAIFLYSLYHTLKCAYYWTLRKLTVSTLVYGYFTPCDTDEDRIYRALLHWLRTHIKDFQTERIVSRSFIRKLNQDDESSCEDEIECHSNRRVRPSPDDVRVYTQKPFPGYSSHFFTHSSALIRMERRVLYKPTIHVHGSTTEVLEFTTFFWNKEIIHKILEEAKPSPKKGEKKDTVSIYVGVQGSHWTPQGKPKNKRPLTSIILENNVTERLVLDIKKFLSLENWYIERGIPYRRAYLLYGPPGCGKSSVIKSLAGELGYDISILSLSQGVTDDSITNMLNNAPEKSIILLEDIDAAFKSREESSTTNLAFEGRSQSALTFRGLLNALDGVGSAEDGLVIFMTTNYPERLDPALVRPGRVDFKALIDYPNESQMEKMFQRFYPEEGEDTLKRFLDAVKKTFVGKKEVSMAMLQGLFLLYKDDPEGAIDNVGDMLGE